VSLKHPVQPVPMPISMDMLRRLQQELESLIAAASASGVLSFNSRAGTVTLLSSDVTGALGFTPGVGDVLSTRLINTTAPLTGGGDLSANRTLGISAATSGAAGSMSAADKTKLDAISGTNTGDQTITLTGDASGSGTSSFAVTFATVNSNTGTFGGAASVPQISVNGKGLITGVTAVGIAAPWADITGKPAAVTSLSGTNTGDQFTNMASSRILGRITGGAGAAEELTGTQVTTLLDVFTSGLKGLAPASGGGTTNFLRADGTWAAPPGGGGGLSDGDKGDVVVGGGGATLTVESATPSGGNFAITGTTTLTDTLTFNGATGADRVIFDLVSANLKPASPGWATINFKDSTDVLRSSIFAGNSDEVFYIDSNKFQAENLAATKQFIYADETKVELYHQDVVKLTTTANGVTIAGDLSVSDEAYAVGWNGSLEVPTKNAVYDKINAGLTAPELAANSGGGTANFLRADGTWAAPGGGGGSGDVVGPAGATDNAVARYDATTGKLLQDSRMFVDDDGRVTNKINSNANEGVITAEHWIKQSADYTLTSTTAEQKMFNTTTNGRLTLPVGTYFFDCQLQLTTRSATSGNVAFDFKGAGTATIDQIMYHVIGYDASNPAAVGTMSGCGAISQQSAVSMVTAATGTGVHASIRGTFRVTVAGTIIPSLSLLTAAAAVVKTGTHFRCWRASDDSTHSVGAWD
jgi:hypothetical protein